MDPLSKQAFSFAYVKEGMRKADEVEFTDLLCAVINRLGDHVHGALALSAA